jgi:SAM-dependent methyltransferase
MFTDVIDLRDFYQSRSGLVAQRMIRRRIRAVWPNLKGQSILGVGYPTPYLRPFMNEAERVAAAMPAAQGVLRWPADGPARSVLVDPDALPFLDATFDRILMVHAVEGSDHLAALLAEAWRLLVGNGRLLVVVPNRHGMWTRSDSTPFGQGHPYTHHQLSRLLRQNRFTPIQKDEALFSPPQAPRGWVRSGEAWEKIGHRWFNRFAGVIMIEANKQLYAPTPNRRQLLAPARAFLPATRSKVSASNHRSGPGGHSCRGMAAGPYRAL